MSAKDEGLRNATVISDGTFTDTIGRRFETVTVVISDDGDHPWKQLVLVKSDPEGKSTLGPVGSHYQCDILESWVRD